MVSKFWCSPWCHNVETHARVLGMVLQLLVCDCFRWHIGGLTTHFGTLVNLTCDLAFQLQYFNSFLALSFCSLHPILAHLLMSSMLSLACALGTFVYCRVHSRFTVSNYSPPYVILSIHLRPISQYLGHNLSCPHPWYSCVSLASLSHQVSISSFLWVGVYVFWKCLGLTFKESTTQSCQ